MAGDGEIKGLIRFGRSFAVLLVFVMLFAMTASASGTDESSSNSGVAFVQMEGKKTPIMLSGTEDAEDLIRRMGVTLGELDEVNIPLEQKVEIGDVIKVTRIKYVNEVERGVLPHETIYYYSGETTPGKETIVVEGEDGFGEQTYKRLMVDGEVKEETLISEDLVKKPITKEIAIGFRTKPVSSLDFEWEFDADGNPINTTKVLSAQTATAYTATGNRTSTGLEAKVGHVAVNPAVIPYGSKLFIQTKDGKHIYGYAIAADTGGAMLSGSADIDLYFNSLSECVRFGVKSVDVFILE